MGFFLDNIKYDLWEYLSGVSKKIVLYGMGDGAEKIKYVLDQYEIPTAAVMASDDFVRGQEFLGYKVKKLSEIEEEFGNDFLILVCFGSQLPEVMDHVKELAETYELYAPCVPVAGDGVFNLEYARENLSKLKRVYDLLADDLSKKVFENVISYKLTGKLNYLWESETPSEEKFDLLGIGAEEVYVDLGAYDGDTLIEFLNETSMQFKKLYAMEPDKKNFRKLKRSLYMIGSAIFEPYNCGAWDEDTTLTLDLRSGRGSRIIPADSVPEKRGGLFNSSRYAEVKMMKTDTMLQGVHATYIKIDTEGCERRALMGAKNTISAWKPKLNVALYHRNEDMFDLPLLVNELNRKYKLYMRHHPYFPDWDTNLYCI